MCQNQALRTWPLISVDCLQGLIFFFLFNGIFIKWHEADVCFTFYVFKRANTYFFYFFLFWSFKTVPLITLYLSFVIFWNVTNTLSNFDLLTAMMMTFLVQKSQASSNNSLGNCRPHAWYVSKKLVQSPDKHLVPARANIWSSSKQ